MARPVLVTVTVQVIRSPGRASAGTEVLAMARVASGVSVPQEGSVVPGGQLESAGPVTALRRSLSPVGGLATVTV